MSSFKSFADEIILWYQKNKRDLPWRKEKDPYKIWVSEIILQQTRVNQGLQYYYNFISQFPTIFDLAKATMDQLMKVWQGLGYYSRARNMHFTANYIVNNFNGKIPDNFKELKKLKGIGEYTAAAIASIAFGQQIAVVDGNVYRVIARYLGVDLPINTSEGKKKVNELSNKLIKNHNPSVYNQAIMDFGALQCVPKKPLCNSCPVKLTCFAFKNNTTGLLPVKNKEIKKLNRYFNYMVIIHNGHTYISKRTKKDIWDSLYEFPLIETGKGINVRQLQKTSDWKNIISNIPLTISYISKPYKHVLTHRNISALFFIIKPAKTGLKKLILWESNFIKIKIAELSNFAFPKLIDNFLKDYPLEDY